MKRKTVIILIVAAFLSVGLVVGRMYYLDKVSSPLSPVISFDEEVLMVSVNATEKELLKGVTATDPEDGDVTDSLLVESMSNMINGNSVNVSYVAFDSNNHMSRAKRTVCYTDYKSPEFALTQPLVFRQSDTINVLNYINATDVFDGDISRKIIYNMGTANSRLALGEHELELRVINSKGDISHLTLSVEVTQADPNPANIQLKEYLVYLGVGDEFDAKSYFESYDINGTEIKSANRISIESDVDTEVPGTYTVSYFMKYGNTESHTRLIVVVE